MHFYLELDNMVAAAAKRQLACLKIAASNCDRLAANGKSSGGMALAIAGSLEWQSQSQSRCPISKNSSSATSSQLAKSL